MRQKIANFKLFVTYDIWRVTEDEVTKPKYLFYTIIKTLYVCISRFIKDHLIDKASALTYSTLLAIVPILAVLFAIARGFGFDELMEQRLRIGLGGTTETSEAIFAFVESYLSETKGGVFIGVGLVMLLWTVINLTIRIELAFNEIWQVKKTRSVHRQMTDYFSMLLLIPILTVISSGLSIFMGTILKEISGYALLGPMIKFLIRLIPFVFTWIMFVALYVYMPNTKVQLKYAIVAAIIAGTAYQGFQFFYISSQVWVTRYNAIYGSFAALPMFLLWLHISWTISLFGAQLAYAAQNIRYFSFEKDTQQISNRYRDFISILIMSLICKRFEHNEQPYTAEELSEQHRIPIRLTKQTLYQLQEVELIHEVSTDQKSDVSAYQPSMDIAQLDVALLLNRLDTYGSEEFKIDKEEAFSEQWKVLLNSRAEYYKSASKVLLKDL